MHRFQTLALALVPPPEWLYAALSLGFGLAFLIITPPFVAPDEGAHFYRSFHVSEGHLAPFRVHDTGGGNLPTSFKTCVNFICSIPWHPEVKFTRRNVADLFSTALAPRERKLQTFMQGCSSGPAAYAPAAVAIALGRLCDDRPVMLVYWGRLGNLLAGTCLVFLAIRVTPVFKHVLMLMALLPMAASQLASLSHDAVTISCSYLLIALVLRAFANPTSAAGAGEQLAVALSAVALALCKMCYFPLSMLCLLIPRSRFKSLAHFAAFQAITLGVSLALAYAWSVTAQGYFPDARSDAIIPCSITEQKAHILDDPLAFLTVIVNTVDRYKGLWASSFVGNLGFLDTPLPRHWVVLYLFALVLTALVDNHPRFRLGWLPRLGVGSLALATIGLMLVALYLWWTPVDWPVVEGIQGRYFLPCAPLLALLLYSHVIKASLSTRARTLLLTAFCCCGLLVTVRTVTDRFYADRHEPWLVLRGMLRLPITVDPARSGPQAGEAPTLFALWGDWDGDGRDSSGSYDPRTGEFVLTREDGGKLAQFQFGPQAADFLPLAGDWNGDGIDSVGLFVAATGGLLLRNEHSAGAADVAAFFGPSRVPRIPLVGDFDGDGQDTVGLYTPSRGEWLLADSLTAISIGPRRTLRFGPAGDQCLPAAGDWDGDGQDTLVVYEPAAARVHFATADGKPAEVRPIERLRAGQQLLATDKTGSGKDALTAETPQAAAAFTALRDQQPRAASVPQ